MTLATPNPNSPKNPNDSFTAAPPAFSKKRKSNLLSLAVTALVVPGLFATVALPAYAVNPVASTEAQEAIEKTEQLKVSDAQQLSVATGASVATVTRASFTASTAAEAHRARLAAAYAAWTGRSAADYLSSPAFPNYSIEQLVAVAKSYIGVPYVYGGSNPSGFDCSGYTMYVFAQFGIALPHSSSAQGRMGARVSPADALPGDLIILDGGSHVGIWLGGGVMIDAPMAGRTVSIRAPYTSNYYFVRVG